MDPCSFDGADTVLGPPLGCPEAMPGVDEGGVVSLSVQRLRAADGSCSVVSCWRPSAEEMEEVQRTGRIWMEVLGESMAPVRLSAHRPEP